MKIFSGLYKFAHGELSILLITYRVAAFRTTLEQGSAERETYPRLEIDEDGTRNVVLVVGLVKEHVLAIATLGRPFLEDAFLVDAVFGTETLPVHGAHLARSPVVP